MSDESPSPVSDESSCGIRKEIEAIGAAITSSEMIDAAAAILKDDQARRVEACKAAIEEAAATYRCRLEPAILITPRGNVPQLNITAEP